VIKETIKLIAVLTLFCVISGFLLAWVNIQTKAPIEASKKAEMSQAFAKILPPYDNDIISDSITTNYMGKELKFYIGKKDGRISGIAFISESQRGYGGKIVIACGISTEDKTIKGIEILEANETPGLGSKIRDTKFLSQFSGKSTVNSEWAKVKKDMGDIDAITGATISSRAVAEAVKIGLDAFNSIKASMMTEENKRNVIQQGEPQ